MSNIGSKAIYMSLEQLLIIFYQRKVEGLLVPDAMSDIDADDRQLKEAMAKMIGEGFIVPDNNGALTLSDEAREIADIIAGAEKIFHIGNIGMPQQFLYAHKGRGVLMNLDVANPKRARLELADVRELLNDVTYYDAMPDEEQLGSVSTTGLISRELPIEDVLNIPDVVTVVDRYLRGAPTSEIRVVVREGDPFALTVIKEQAEDYVYAPDLFTNFLMEE